MFWLVERFFSIQGEGRYAGVPSYFLRTGGCNLHCPGFGASYEVEGQRRLGCDTWFAVDRAFQKEWEAVTDPKGLLEELERKFREIGYLPDVVITGGEPMLYAADEAFYETIKALVRRGISVTFETNGTIAPDFERFPLYSECIFALSVKLSNSAEPRERRLDAGVLKRIAAYGREYFLKYTIDRELIESGRAAEEIGEIRSILPESEIFCMPVGESREAIARNDRHVLRFCMKHGLRYSDRLHIRIFDMTQGV